MRKNLLLYVISFALLAFNFLFFNRANQAQHLYSSLIDTANTVYSCYQDLARKINNAAIMNPGLVRAADSANAVSLFFTDSQQVIRPLARLHSAVKDSTNRKISRELDILVRSEIGWILKSNVPDSIIHNRSVAHTRVFKKIDSLINAGILRTEFLLAYRKKKQQEATSLVNLWMAVFVILSTALIILTALRFFKQRLKSESKDRELEAVGGKLKETELSYRAIIEQAADAVFVTDADFRFVDINPSACKMLGYSKQEFLQLLPTDLVFSEDLISNPLKTDEMAQGKTLRFERRIKRKDGTALETEVSTAMLEDGRSIVFARDITERKRAESELLKTVKSLDDYRFALNESTIIAFTDKRGIITTVNDNFCKISKYSKEELVGNTHKLINSGFHPKEFFKDLWLTISSGKVWKGEIKNRAKTGEYYWVYTSIIPFLDNDNKPFQYLAIRFDITERKLAEEAAFNTLNERNTILESIGDAFFAVDRDWIVTYWNRVAEKALFKPKHEIIGKNLWEVYPDSIDSESYRNYNLAMETNQVVHFEDYYQPLNTWYEISAYPSQTGLSVYFKDISERKISDIRLNQLNEELQQHAQKLLISNQELEQFAYVASHDLQEPLRMVTGFLTQLEKKYGDIIDDKGKQYINFAVDGAKRMRQIILDLLEFSRVGRTEDKLETVDLDELIDEVRILFRKTIEEKKATITTENLPSLKVYRTPMQQVFQNLIGNALKYSRKDVSPLIEITAKEFTDHWQVAVKDNGIGIDKEYYERIFIIFQRLHNKDEFSGTGMGLAISNKIIENQGGRIWVESEEGKGSTFYFTIIKK